ncbi:MAG: hypothetical protein OES46_21675, partial [Gammaproteobacteria bacterium]|nr:hypothetical protein [Gammaproteobacteria bacterium]
VAKTKAHLATLHDEAEKLRWKFLGTQHRRIRKSDYIHVSVKQRYSRKRSYRPVTLTRFIESRRWEHVREWERVLT